MLMMRLQRVGRRNDPSYRVVVTDKRTGPKSNKHVEVLGSYNPKMNAIQIKGDRVKHWISQGVQVSDTVHNLLVSEKLIEGKKVNVLPKKSPIVDEAAVAAAAEAEAASADTPKEVAAEDTSEEAVEEASETPAETETTEAETEKATA